MILTEETKSDNKLLFEDSITHYPLSLGNFYRFEDHRVECVLNVYISFQHSRTVQPLQAKSRIIFATLKVWVYRRS